MQLGAQAADKSATSFCTYNCFNATGKVFERIHFSHYAYATGSDTFSILIPINFRNRLSGTVTSAVTIVLSSGFSTAPVFNQPSSADGGDWGGYISGTTDALTVGDPYFVIGYVDIDQA
jgi:hypothetical protein